MAPHMHPVPPAFTVPITRSFTPSGASTANRSTMSLTRGFMLNMAPRASVGDTPVFSFTSSSFSLRGVTASASFGGTPRLYARLRLGSASTARTLYPSLERSLDRVAETKVLPTPPFPATAIFIGVLLVPGFRQDFFD